MTARTAGALSGTSSIEDAKQSGTLIVPHYYIDVNRPYCFIFFRFVLRSYLYIPLRMNMDVNKGAYHVPQWVLDNIFYVFYADVDS